VDGDFILVDKFRYGLRLPLTNTQSAVNRGEPQRGDVIVLRFHVGATDQNLIKRLVGLPGDHSGRSRQIASRSMGHPVRSSPAGADMRTGAYRVPRVAELQRERVRPRPITRSCWHRKAWAVDFRNAVVADRALFLHGATQPQTTVEDTAASPRLDSCRRTISVGGAPSASGLNWRVPRLASPGAHLDAQSGSLHTRARVTARTLMATHFPATGALSPPAPSGLRPPCDSLPGSLQILTGPVYGGDPAEGPHESLS